MAYSVEIFLMSRGRQKSKKNEVNAGTDNTISAAYLYTSDSSDIKQAILDELKAVLCRIAGFLVVWISHQRGLNVCCSYFMHKLQSGILQYDISDHHPIFFLAKTVPTTQTQ